jgi:hypothetical protein
MSNPHGLWLFYDKAIELKWKCKTRGVFIATCFDNSKVKSFESIIKKNVWVCLEPLVFHYGYGC